VLLLKDAADLNQQIVLRFITIDLSHGLMHNNILLVITRKEEYRVHDILPLQESQTTALCLMNDESGKSIRWQRRQMTDLGLV
jgi:hypothetical protein